MRNIWQGDKEKIKSLVDELVLLKSEYKEKSGKDYGSAPPKDKKEKEGKKEKTPAVGEKPVAAPKAVVAVRFYIWLYYIYSTAFICHFFYYFLCIDTMIFMKIRLDSFFSCLLCCDYRLRFFLSLQYFFLE